MNPMRKTTWLVQIAVAVMLLASGTASAATGFLTPNLHQEQNTGQAALHQVSASLSVASHQGCGDLCAYDAAGFFVAPNNIVQYGRRYLGRSHGNTLNEIEILRRQLRLNPGSPTATGPGINRPRILQRLNDLNDTLPPEIRNRIDEIEGLKDIQRDATLLGETEAARHLGIQINELTDELLDSLEAVATPPLPWYSD